MKSLKLFIAALPVVMMAAPAQAFYFDNKNTLRFAGAVTTIVGIKMVADNIYLLNVGRNRVAGAEARAQAALVYPELAQMNADIRAERAAISKLGFEKAPQHVIFEANERLEMLVAQRDFRMTEILERDFRRYDPLAEGRPMPESVRLAREAMPPEQRKALRQIRRSIRGKGLGAIAMIGSGVMILVATAPSVEDVTEPIARVMREMDEPTREVVAEHIGRTPELADMTLEDIFDHSRN